MTPPEPPKRRKGKAGALTIERLRVLVATYAALGTARLQASMPAPHAVPYLLRCALEEGYLPELKGDAPALLRCLVQLEEGAHGDPMSLLEAEQLLVATVQAKVAEHAKRDGDFKAGTHATIGALTVKANFGKWLAAGRVWLHRNRKAAPKQEPGIVVVDGAALTDEERKVWAEWRPTSLAEADKRVRWMRTERLELAGRARDAAQ